MTEVRRRKRKGTAVLSGENPTGLFGVRILTVFVMVTQPELPASGGCTLSEFQSLKSVKRCHRCQCG